MRDCREPVLIVMENKGAQKVNDIWSGLSAKLRAKVPNSPSKVTPAKASASAASVSRGCEASEFESNVGLAEVVLTGFVSRLHFNTHFVLQLQKHGGRPHWTSFNSTIMYLAESRQELSLVTAPEGSSIRADVLSGACKVRRAYGKFDGDLGRAMRDNRIEWREKVDGAWETCQIQVLLHADAVGNSPRGGGKSAPTMSPDGDSFRGAQTPPMKKEDILRSVPAREFQTTCAKRRCHAWTEEKAVAEFVQNWKDEADGAAMRVGRSPHHIKIDCKLIGEPLTAVIYDLYLPALDVSSTPTVLATLSVKRASGQTSLLLTNYSAKMMPEMFLDGWSSKEGGHARGRFGDGLQSGIAVLLRNCIINVAILSSSHEWKFSWEPSAWVKSSVQNSECLCFSTHATIVQEGIFHSARDTRVEILGLPTDAFDAGQFLFLDPDYANASPAEMISNPVGDILLGDDQKGTLFVKGMRVHHGDGKNTHGLNLKVLSMESRDRTNNLKELDKLFHVFMVWHVELLRRNQTAADLLIASLVGEPESLEALALAQNEESLAPVASSMLSEAFCRMFPGALPVEDTDHELVALVTKRFRRRAQCVPKQLSTALLRGLGAEKPWLAWQRLRAELLRSEDDPWTESCRLAVASLQEALLTGPFANVGDPLEASSEGPGSQATRWRLVCREDLHVPLVASVPEPPVILSNVACVVNRTVCVFHDPAAAGVQCSYAGQAVCFCGVDRLHMALLEEFRAELGTATFSPERELQISARLRGALERRRNDFEAAQRAAAASGTSSGVSACNASGMPGAGTEAPAPASRKRALDVIDLEDDDGNLSPNQPAASPFVVLAGSCWYESVMIPGSREQPPTVCYELGAWSPASGGRLVCWRSLLRRGGWERVERVWLLTSMAAGQWVLKYPSAGNGASSSWEVSASQLTPGRPTPPTRLRWHRCCLESGCKRMQCNDVSEWTLEAKPGRRHGRPTLAAARMWSAAGRGKLVLSKPKVSRGRVRGAGTTGAPSASAGVDEALDARRAPGGARGRPRGPRRKGRRRRR